MAKERVLRLDEVEIRAYNGRVETWNGPIPHLPKKYQNMFEKRYLENWAVHKLRHEEAAVEARQFITLAMYREKEKKAEKARQLALFDIGVKPQRTSMRVAEQGGGR
jgi:hypothetical protein